MIVVLPTWIEDRIAVQDNGCWHWTTTITDDGYGRAERINGSPAKMAHRAVYMALVGPIPDGLHLGHVCHDRDESCRGGIGCLHRRCVNPEHLQPMTLQENSAAAAGRPARRRTHCRHGHAMTPDNTYEHGGCRSCRTCRRDANRRFYQTLDDPTAYYTAPAGTRTKGTTS